MVKKSRRLKGTLLCRGISVSMTLGVLPSEQLEPRLVYIDAVWKGELLSDEKPTVDYARVTAELRTGLKKSYEYIEQVAADALDILLTSWPGSWTVSVHKDFPDTELRMERATVSVSS